MGDRVSIQFKNGDEISVAFFSHWDGMDLVDCAKQYFKELKREQMLNKLKDEKDFDVSDISGPLSRLEPRTIMVDFIRWFVKMRGVDERIWSNYYLGVDANDGDNSDNGNHILDVVEEWKNA